MFAIDESFDEDFAEETSERCLWCGARAFVELLEYYASTREFELDYCCETNRDGWVDEMRGWDGATWARFFEEHAGVPGVRSVGGEPAKREAIGVGPDEEWLVDRGVTLVASGTIGDRLAGDSRPGALSRDELREYVREFHAHAGDPPAGMFWGYAVYNGPPSDPEYDGVPRFSSQIEGRRPLNLKRWPANLIGVALVGRPWARKTAEKAKKTGETIADVTRVALNHGLAPFLTYKASSAIYEAAAEDAAAWGFARIQTFTLASESGMSLRYARWKPVAKTEKGRQISRPSRARRERSEELSSEKTKWELVLRKRPTIRVRARKSEGSSR